MCVCVRACAVCDYICPSVWRKWLGQRYCVRVWRAFCLMRCLWGCWPLDIFMAEGPMRQWTMTSQRQTVFNYHFQNRRAFGHTHTPTHIAQSSTKGIKNTWVKQRKLTNDTTLYLVFVSYLRLGRGGSPVCYYFSKGSSKILFTINFYKLPSILHWGSHLISNVRCDMK